MSNAGQDPISAGIIAQAQRENDALRASQLRYATFMRGEVAALRATIARVRAMCDEAQTHRPGLSVWVPTGRILAALDEA